MKTKCCVKCKETKSVEEFSPDERRKDGCYARCKTCRVEDCRVHREANKEKVQESAREWARRNKPRMRQYADDNRFMMALHKSKHSAKKHGHVQCLATVDELKAAFDGKCAACGVPEMELTKKLCVDHCHRTGAFRGFLCVRCNRALGLLGDSEEILIGLLHHLMSGVEQE